MEVLTPVKSLETSRMGWASGLRLGVGVVWSEELSEAVDTEPR